MLSINILKRFLGIGVVNLWVANTTYAIGDRVYNSSNYYTCKTANSDATFTSSKWTLEINKDPFLQECIDEAISEAEGYCNRKLASVDVTRYYSVGINTGLNANAYSRFTGYYGRGAGFYFSPNRVLNLGEMPINSITSLQKLNSSGVFEDIITSPDTIADSTLILDNGDIMLLKSYVFPTGTNNIKAVFNAGYTAIDNWIGSYTYLVNDLVLYNSVYYKCNTANSDATFTIAKWDVYTITTATMPNELNKAFKWLATKQYYESPANKGTFMKASENKAGQPGAGYSFDRKSIMDDVYGILDSYKIPNI